MIDNSKKIIQKKRMDYLLMVSVLLLICIGILMVYSSSFYQMISDGMSETKSYFRASIKYAGIGVFLMVLLSFFDYRYFKKFPVVVFIIITTILLFVLLNFKGVESKGATRVVKIMGFSVMPTEVAKITVIISLSWLFDYAKKNIKKVRIYFISILFVSFFSMLILFVTNDFSSAFLLFTTGFIMMFVMGLNFFGILFSGIIGSAFVYLSISMNKMRMWRMSKFIESIFDRTYVFDRGNEQTLYSIYSVAEGGIFGTKLGAGLLKTRLPEPYSDFIFATIAEEFGFLGVFLVIIIFLFILWRFVIIALNTDDIFSFSLVSGSAILIALQSFINIAVVLNILPVTGIPLPFISRGGSSLVMLCILIGIVLNISYKNTITYNGR